MYCKSCGKEMKENTPICLNCGMDPREKGGFCGHCGSQIQEGQYLCVKCGFLVDGTEKIKTVEQTTAIQGKVEEPKEKVYLKYKDQIIKINYLQLATLLLSIVYVFMALLLPVYICKYEISLDEIENFEQLGEVIDNNGMVEKTFSLTDDLILMIKSLELEVSDPANLLSTYFVGIMLVIVFASVVYESMRQIPNVIKKATELKNIDTSVMLRYHAVKTNGNKESTMKMISEMGQKMNVGVITFFIAIDIFLCKLTKKILFDSAGNNAKFSRYMFDFTGFSGAIIVLIVILIAFIVANRILKKEEESLSLKIAKEEYDT